MKGEDMFIAPNFDTSSLPTNAVIFDNSGTIDFGPYTTDPGPSGFNPTVFYTWLDQLLTSAGYGDTFSNLAIDYPNATFFYGMETVLNTGPNQWVTNLDNGIQGTSGRDIIVDPNGNNIIDAGSGNDLVLTGYGNDLISGGNGRDLIFADAGNDIVDGGRGADRIYLFDGDDQASGGRGADSLYGEQGEDTLWGGSGKDLLDGGTGNDLLYGEGGDDTLLGGAGDDILNGGNRNDRLEGGSGSDLLTGGNGRDVFVYGLSDDDDTITDFDPARDTIELDADLGATTFSDLQQIAQQVGDDVVLDFGNGDILTIEDVAWTDLDSSDFVLI